MVDLLAVCAHPDDLEVCAGGIFIKAKKEGKKTGLILLTRGEAGGHADMQTRLHEAGEGARLMGIDYFSQLEFPDAGLFLTKETVEKVAPHIRACSPKLIFTLHPEDYHPDHAAVSHIAESAAFVAGLNKYSEDGSDWHYDGIVYFSADLKTNPKRPDLLVDITAEAEQKRLACAAHASQNVEGFAMNMARRWGELAGVPYAEGLYLKQSLLMHSLSSFFQE